MKRRVMSVIIGCCVAVGMTGVTWAGISPPPKLIKTNPKPPVPKEKNQGKQKSAPSTKNICR